MHIHQALVIIGHSTEGHFGNALARNDQMHLHTAMFTVAYNGYKMST